MKPLLAPCLPCALVIITAAAPAAANPDGWEKIVSNGTHSVEINPSAIFDAERGVKVSWGRIVLSDSEMEQAGYRTIKAMNRYDCLGRSFTTIKRIYIDDFGNILREENVPEQQPVTVRSNSADELIWRKVCGLPMPSATRNAGHRARAAPKDAVSRINELADTAAQAARNALPPAVKAPPPPPRAMPLPAAAATIEPRPASMDSPPPPTLPIQIKPLPMPIAPPVAPIAPKRPELPLAPQSRFDASPPPRRIPEEIQLLPAPAVSARKPENRPAPAPAPTPALLPDNGEDWSYSGATGPEFWGKLRPEWRSCAEGKRQSPIDFMEGKPITVSLDPVKFDYRPASFVIINAHRQLRIRISEGMSMEVRGQRYTLEGFTLHRPAETHFDNRIADMEAHFFHRGDKGQIAVLAVQFMRGKESSAPLQILLNNLPLEKGDSYKPQISLDMAGFLPASPAHTLYMGSLTTPPCTEGVLWVVMKEPMPLSDEQFEVFARLHAENARPPQPAFDRLILESR